MNCFSNDCLYTWRGSSPNLSLSATVMIWWIGFPKSKVPPKLSRIPITLLTSIRVPSRSSLTSRSASASRGSEMFTNMISFHLSSITARIESSGPSAAFFRLWTPSSIFWKLGSTSERYGFYLEWERQDAGLSIELVPFFNVPIQKALVWSKTSDSLKFKFRVVFQVGTYFASFYYVSINVLCQNLANSRRTVGDPRTNLVHVIEKVLPCCWRYWLKVFFS